jgi:hypothetical protein
MEWLDERHNSLMVFSVYQLAESLAWLPVSVGIASTVAQISQEVGPMGSESLEKFGCDQRGTI